MKHQLFELFEGWPRVTKAQHLLDRFSMLSVVMGWVMGAMLSLPTLRATTVVRYELALWILGGCVFGEYLIRLWISGYDPDEKYAAWLERFRFGFWSLNVLDPIAVSILAYGLLTKQPEFVTGGFTVRLFRVFRFTTADDVVWEALRRGRIHLQAVLTLWAVVVFGGAGMVYAVEHKAQPDKFTDVFSSLYYTFVTFTTTGYGDLYPITPLGRLVGILVMLISAICLLGMPIGIIAGEFITIQNEKHEETHGKTD